MVQSVMIAILIVDIVDIAMLIISISCLKDTIKAEKQVEITLKSIKYLHRILELKAQNRKTERTIYPKKEQERWE